MSINRLAQVVAIVLTLGAGAAFVAAEAQQSTSQLVTTTCDAGHVTECGQKPTYYTCEWSFSANYLPGGVSFSFQKCTAHGGQKLYKDFYRDAATGTCVVTRFPTDPRRDEEGDPELDSSC